jgi:hypothetical protein
MRTVKDATSIRLETDLQPVTRRPWTGFDPLVQ